MSLSTLCFASRTPRLSWLVCHSLLHTDTHFDSTGVASIMNCITVVTGVIQSTAGPLPGDMVH